MHTLSHWISRKGLFAAALSASALVGSVAHAGVVTSSDGTNFSVDWEPVGYPSSQMNTVRIAACSPTKIYLLDGNHQLWLNYAGGIAQNWRYMDTPSLADSIGCDGPTLIAMNYDKTLYREVLTSAGTHYGWVYLGSAGSAATIGGGAGVITALNFDKSVYTSVGNDGTTFPAQSWSYRDTASVAGRVTGAINSHMAGRFFALNTDHSMWFNDGLILRQPGQWRSFPIGLPKGVVPVEITAASPGLLFVLDSNNELWTAQSDGLAVPVVGQEQSNWCWAATAQMIGQYVGGVALQQCQLANINTGRTDCCTSWFSAGNTNYCNQGGWWPLDQYGFTYTNVWNNALPWYTLYQENAANRPVAFAWHWNSGGGHAMVQEGTKQLYVNGSAQNWVTINDPEPVGRGTQTDMLYTSWVSGPTYSHWVDSYQMTKH